MSELSQTGGRTSFGTQANALLRKNLTYQKRNMKSNICLISFPMLLCVLLALLKHFIDKEARSPSFIPQKLSSGFQVPEPSYRAVRTDYTSFTGFPNNSCRDTRSCPATILFTGKNSTFGKSLVESIFTNSIYYNSSDISYTLAKSILGSDTETDFNLYKGYHNGNAEEKINEMIGAYDFLNSNLNNFNMSVSYNATYKHKTRNVPISLTQVSRAINLISNSYLQLLRGPSTEMLLEFDKEMPKPEIEQNSDISSYVGPFFFLWVVIQLFPVILKSLVYEKQERLRILMKMHGLGDGPYWVITYGYFLVLSTTHMLCFVIFGSVIGLKFFTLNAYSIQFVFYFIYINLQISLAFLVSAMFSNSKTATVVGYILVFLSGISGNIVFPYFLKNTSFPRGWVIVMELYPSFSLFRGLYEFGRYSKGYDIGTRGMRWVDLSNNDNGLGNVFIIMLLEWIVVLFVAYYIDQVISAGSGIGRSPLFCLERFRKNSSSYPSRKPSLERQGSMVLEMDKLDVVQEREKVRELLLEPSTHAVVCDDLKKTYPRRDGNPEKYAVRGISLALPQGECFGMLGPNGAGKTSFINMMIGLIKPTSGAAYVHGLDIRTQMNKIYSNMGVCLQHDLLWESLTGREHLLFYGRLKNLKGSDLTQAVEESLKSVNLSGIFADRKAGKYSGGMRRRLSVAISLIGNPKVVYMDEPSTGLDPASRNNLWNVVKRAKQDRAIILTTHSMEEAEHLCDRLGIFVDGSLQCIGNPKELKARYGGSYVLTMTTSSDFEEEVDKLVQSLSANAKKVYHLSGTQKFELPKQEVRIADVFRAVGNAKSKFAIYAWGLADTTLEDVFIKVARGAQSSNVLS